MTPEEKLDLVAKQLSATMLEVSALGDLVSVLFAELAAVAPDRAARLAEMTEAERGAAMAAASFKDEHSEQEKQVMIRKAEVKNRVFNLSEQILSRIEATRS